MAAQMAAQLAAARGARGARGETAPPPDPPLHDYKAALSLCLDFLDAQKSGDLGLFLSRLKSDLTLSHVQDGSAVGRDLAGGCYGDSKADGHPPPPLAQQLSHARRKRRGARSGRGVLCGWGGGEADGGDCIRYEHAGLEHSGVRCPTIPHSPSPSPSPELETTGLKQRAVDLLKWGVDWLLMAEMGRGGVTCSNGEWTGCSWWTWAGAVPGLTSPSLYSPLSLRSSPELETTGLKQRAVDLLKWGVDWLLMADLGRGCVVAQVGDSAAQNSCWQRPEDDSTARPVYTVVGANGPGAAVLADMSAAFAAGEMPLLLVRMSLSLSVGLRYAVCLIWGEEGLRAAVLTDMSAAFAAGEVPWLLPPRMYSTSLTPDMPPCCGATPPFPTPASFPLCDPTTFAPRPLLPTNTPAAHVFGEFSPGYAALLRDHTTIPNSCYFPLCAPTSIPSLALPSFQTSLTSSHVFGEFDPGYAASLRDHATMLFELATTATSTDDTALPGTLPYQPPPSSLPEFHDELLWAAAWLWRTTMSDPLHQFLLKPQHASLSYTLAFTHANKAAGAAVLLATFVLGPMEEEDEATTEASGADVIFRFQKLVEASICASTADVPSRTSADTLAQNMPKTQ
ncbi:unnamed protein product, partial [Closterium sp. Naga37s-1]